MKNSPSELPDSLRAKFPELRPITKAPPLTTVNGIGLTMYGKRDLDAETGSYVKTHVFCVVFIPILALGAYRVADAERGWYFIGKERLSSFARSFNLGVLCLSLLFAGVMVERAYRSSPTYIAGRELKRAEAAMASGDVLEAAKAYREVMFGGARQAEGRTGLQQALERCITNKSPDVVEKGFRLLAGLGRQGQPPDAIVTQAYIKGVAAIERWRGQPESALNVLAEVRKLGEPTNAALDAVQVELLKEAIAAQPNATNRVVELALIYEMQQKPQETVELLQPYREKLGASEGARILGKHLLNEGKNDEAYALLFPYVQSRLEHLHQVESRYTNAMASAYKRGFDHLDSGKADRSFYDRYEKAGEAEQQQIVHAFLQDWMRQDAEFRRAGEALVEANRIVEVTLDLGIVQLNRAQNLADPAARKKELEAAEKTFLAIRGLAGDTDEYRMFLGQVYYWLGRSAEGKALFDELLASKKRAFPILMALGTTLRGVGETEQARALLEEAYGTATEQNEKYQAASLRARVYKDMEDQISWLEKADPQEVSIQAALNSARGEKALADGDRESAARYLRQAIDGYRKAGQSAAALNNCGLAWLTLFEVTGDVDNYTKGLELLEQAVALMPGDSLLMMNFSHLLLKRAFMDVVGDAIHWNALKESPDLRMLMHLYKDEPGRANIFRQLQEDAYMRKALTCLDKALLLAPKSQDLYQLELALQSSFRDLVELEKLERRMEIAALDTAETRRQTMEVYQGVKENENLERVLREIARYEGLLTQEAVKEHAPTLRFARLQLNQMKQSAATLGQPADVAALVEEAAALHREAPTRGSLSVLVGALFLRAHEDLKRAHLEYAAVAERTRRSLGPRELIAWTMERETALGRSVRNNPLVQQAMNAVKEQRDLFPSTPDPADWAMLRGANAGEAAALAGRIRDDKVGRARDRMQFALNPAAARLVLEQFWDHEMAGDQAGAVAMYRKAVDEGVPLPPLE